MRVTVENTNIEAVKIVRPGVIGDERGFFTEMYRMDEFQAMGLPWLFPQLNYSRSAKNTVRGLHFQWDPPMGKLMRVARGTAYLVAVDIRKDSPTLGEYCGRVLSDNEITFIWAPAGFARGFAALADDTEIMYLTTGTYNAKGESGVLWNDPDIGIRWPVRDPLLSEKDKSAQRLAEWLRRPEADFFNTQVAA